MKKESVAVLFGGNSAEHEISVITAIQAMQAMDSEKYEIIPVYISQIGKWYTGKSLFHKQTYQKLPQSLSTAQEVVLLPDPTVQGLIPISEKGTFEINKKIPIDICFLAFHGQHGEDGCIQGLLELANLPYTGCNVSSSAVAMNKYMCKTFLQAHNIPVLPSVRIFREEIIKDLKKVKEKILSTKGLESFPLFVKPNNLGSSIGIMPAQGERTLLAALANAFQYDTEAIIEPFISQRLEINVSVMDGNPPIASVVEIPISSGVALSYEDKYLRGETKNGQSQGMASLTRIIDPKDLDAGIKKSIQKYAIEAFQLLNCSGAGRFDFMIDLTNGQIYFNELNPIPGSLAFYLWEKSSPALLYTEMLSHMLEQAKIVKQRKMALKTKIPFTALKS